MAQHFYLKHSNSQCFSDRAPFHPPIDRTMRLEVQDRRECVAANSLLIDRAFNSVNRIVHRLIPQIRKLEIVPSPAIGRIARDSGSLRT